MTKVLVTGGNGQLGQSLQKAVKPQKLLDFDFQDLQNLDLTNRQNLEAYFSKNPIKYCINCAAYTAVDLAEEQEDMAYAVNANGVRNLTEVCKKHQVTLLHISTDFVFDGKQTTPYTEHDDPKPLGI